MNTRIFGTKIAKKESKKMNREIHKINLQGITGIDRIRAIDIISAALAAQYHRNILVLNEGYASDAALEQIPSTVKIFIVEAEKKPISAEPEIQLDESYNISVHGFKSINVDND